MRFLNPAMETGTENTAESMSYCLALILATERVMTVGKKSKKGRMADA